MCYKILITGSLGLIGTALSQMFEAKGIEIIPFDLLATGKSFGDVRNLIQVQKAMYGCDGVIHLAAISRVLWGEQNPELCWDTNVHGLENVLTVASESETSPWVVFASSREVYGQPESLPVTEECPVCPVNIYGRSKVKGEQLIDAARSNGVRACTIRLSNVFGTTADHADRVVPAFARGAALGETLRIDGADHTFDFTHINDVARGIVLLAEYLLAGKDAPPPIHFVSGQPTTLGELAQQAIGIANNGANIRHAPPRTFDVGKFIGDGSRALDLLGWAPQVTLQDGLERLIQAFQKDVCASENGEAV